MSVDQMRDRLNDLHKLLDAELKQKKPAQTYISDLNDSIDALKRQLSFHIKNPDGVQIVNGA